MLISHLDKGLNEIKYNFLNLPVSVKKNNNSGAFGSLSSYLYRTDGTKLKKIYSYYKSDWQGNTSLALTTTDYLDGFQYVLESSGLGCLDCPPVSPTLQFMPTAEGYFDFVKNKYIYNYVDHLGNIRLSYFNDGTATVVLDENNYYPFGLKHEGVNVLEGNPAYQYKYNGKELQESGMYDYGARMYMPDIGRWGVIDPAAELGRRFSPYNYAFDNPVMFIDPDGMWPWPTWGQVKSFGRGAWNTTVGMVKGLATSNGISGVLQGGREFKKVYNAYRTGGAKAAAKQYVNSLYETSGAKAIVQTAKGVAKGDAESIGSATVMVAAAVVTHKAAGGTKVRKTTTVTEAETTTLHRGVNSTSPAYSQAVEGTATPRGGNATPLEHNTVTTESNYTSWTTNPAVAENFALRTSREGVVLTADIPNSQLVQSPNLKSVNLVQSPGTIVSESETLVKGTVTGADVKKVNLER
ncbi:hypothetical protein DRF59_16305 [Chryseobacterium flavum]|uniref:RHS repeat-associated core domain-containing protein n=1 Tax=Chryseobacterium flavum TaxID=415851 RepID=A0A3D9CHQ5_9FLAO|nr:RHS repeat-associated core domain-containing protein [Chryseobacterium flavum]REC65308.1 hypothetical protein DRF59_16305 [Chryseobacterium flavum]